MCTSSKQLRCDCLQLLQGQPLKSTAAVLVAAVEDAARTGVSSLQEETITAVWWLLNTALSPITVAELLSLSSLVKDLLFVHNMPLGLAEGLCRRGLCVQYVKVAAAAHYKWQVAGETH